jgi:hypothetical protein
MSESDSLDVLKDALSSSTKSSSNTNGVPGCDSCTEYYMRFVSCLKPKYQFTEYHRAGQMDYCPAYFGDWTICLQAKLSSDENKKYQLMKTTTTYKQYVEQASRNSPWDNKEKPNW